MQAVAGLALAIAVAAPAALALTPTPGFVRPTLDFELVMDPPYPRVGDTIRLEFSATPVNVPAGLPAWSIDAGELALVGESYVEHHSFAQSAVFEVRAESEGSYSVGVLVSFEYGKTYDSGSCCIWQFGSDSSPDYEIQVLPKGAVVPHPSPTIQPTPTPTTMPQEALGQRAVCPGDCDENYVVLVNELILGVGIALRTTDKSSCEVFGEAPVTELISGVRSLLDGCGTTARLEPGELVPSRCERCCESCVDASCVSECVGRDRCVLVAERFGQVVDADTGDPIAGAEVRLNGISSFTDAAGYYRVLSRSDEACTGLDYLYTLQVAARGYVTATEEFYRTPEPLSVQRIIELAKDSGSAVVGIVHYGN